MVSINTFLLGIHITAACSEVIVKDITADNSYVGSFSQDRTIENFRGIAYGQDTSGQHRFAPPRAVEVPAGAVVNATQPGTACPQPMQDSPPAFFKPSRIGEDCLNLFIARPANTTSSSALPVLVWLHGGGFMYGSGDDAHTAPEKLIALSVELKQPILFVGINFRLGMFGFAASDTLKSQKSENIGLRDQRLAFEWLRDHIAAFGGDPERMTAYGLSAGGTALSFHHVSYGGKKGVPFNQAFMMSGPTGTSRYQSTDHTQKNTAAVAEQLGCPTTGAEMLKCLRNIDMDRLIEVSYAYAIKRSPPMGLHTYLPVVDDDFLPDRASVLLSEGKFVKGIPSILAWTEDDGAMNIGPANLVPDEKGLMMLLHPWISGVLNESQTQQLLELYPTNDFEESARVYNDNKPGDAPEISPHWYRGSKYIRDVLFVCPSIDFTYNVFKHTRATLDTQFDNVRMYQFNQSVMTPMLKMMGMGYVGAAHGSDSHYVFNGVFPEGSIEDGDLRLARQFSASIINFAYTGNPVIKNANTFSEWPVAYRSIISDHEKDEMPSEINLLVIGGPHGTNPVHLVKPSNSKNNASTTLPGAPNGILDTLQQVIGAKFIARMGNADQQEVQSVVEKQKIFERCKFINGLNEALSI